MIGHPMGYTVMTIDIINALLEDTQLSPVTEPTAVLPTELQLPPPISATNDIRNINKHWIY